MGAAGGPFTRLAVIGFGLTGRAVAAFAVQRGATVVVIEDGPTDAQADAAAELGVALLPTPDGGAPALAELFRKYELVVPSPGVPPAHPAYRAARLAGVPLISEIELAARTLPAGRRIVAITGTNGKTTVTTLVAAILGTAHHRAVAAGNIGVPLIEAVQGDADVVVAEVSSFQLKFTSRFRPAVSCWLNLAEDHLDWHPDPDDYADSKARVWANQGRGDVAVYNADDPVVSRRASAIPAGTTKVAFSTRGPADFSVSGGSLSGPGGPIMGLGELPRALPHDVANSLAAAAVASAAGASYEACRVGLAETAPLPHRVELVAEADGVRWYDDSKATTPASVLAAAAGFGSVVLIAGGRNKGLDLGVLAGAVPPIRAAVAIGEAAGEVVLALGAKVRVEKAESMGAAVEAAARAARPGDVVLLSPGCASFDWYPSYAARGDHFAAIVKEKLDKGGDQC